MKNNCLILNPTIRFIVNLVKSMSRNAEMEDAIVNEKGGGNYKGNKASNEYITNKLPCEQQLSILRSFK